MDVILLELLLRLEAIGNEHEELFDSEVRERMGKAIFHGFVKPMHDFQLADDFGMFSSDANAQVRFALGQYLEQANALAVNLHLNTFHQRLAAFQNDSVRTPGRVWNDSDEFFGTTNPDSYDHEGNVINTDLR